MPHAIRAGLGSSAVKLATSYATMLDGSSQLVGGRPEDLYQASLAKLLISLTLIATVLHVQETDVFDDLKPLFFR